MGSEDPSPEGFRSHLSPFNVLQAKEQKEKKKTKLNHTSVSSADKSFLLSRHFSDKRYVILFFTYL